MESTKLARFNSIVGRVIELNVNMEKVQISKIECAFNNQENIYECKVTYNEGEECKIFKYTCIDEDVVDNSCMFDLKFHLDREGICWECK